MVKITNLASAAIYFYAYTCVSGETVKTSSSSVSSTSKAQTTSMHPSMTEKTHMLKRTYSSHTDYDDDDEDDFDTIYISRYTTAVVVTVSSKSSGKISSVLPLPQDTAAAEPTTFTVSFSAPTTYSVPQPSSASTTTITTTTTEVGYTTVSSLKTLTTTPCDNCSDKVSSSSSDLPGTTYFYPTGTSQNTKVTETKFLTGAILTVTQSGESSASASGDSWSYTDRTENNIESLTVSTKVGTISLPSVNSKPTYKWTSSEDSSSSSEDYTITLTRTRTSTRPDSTVAPVATQSSAETTQETDSSDGTTTGSSSSAQATFTNAQSEFTGSQSEWAGPETTATPEWTAPEDNLNNLGSVSTTFDVGSAVYFTRTETPDVSTTPARTAPGAIEPSVTGGDSSFTDDESFSIATDENFTGEGSFSTATEDSFTDDESVPTATDDSFTDDESFPTTTDDSFTDDSSFPTDTEAYTDMATPMPTTDNVDENCIDCGNELPTPSTVYTTVTSCSYGEPCAVPFGPTTITVYTCDTTAPCTVCHTEAPVAPEPTAPAPIMPIAPGTVGPNEVSPTPNTIKSEPFPAPTTPVIVNPVQPAPEYSAPVQFQGGVESLYLPAGKLLATVAALVVFFV